MANTVPGNAPIEQVRQRRRKSAKERRAQRCRATARAFQTVATALLDVKLHRGGALQDVGSCWLRHILRPKLDEIPIPIFTIQRTYGNVVLQSNGSDHASVSCSDSNSMQDPEPMQDIYDEQCGSEGEDQESEELVSRSPSESEGAHSNVALSQPSGDEASDSDLETEEEVRKAIVDDPEKQALFRQIYLPVIHRKEKLSFEEIAGSDYCRKFDIGDLVRPLYCLANLKAYRYGAIGKVVDLDAEHALLCLDFFDDKGNLRNERIVHFSAHYEKICTIDILEEEPYIPRNIMLEDCGEQLVRSAKVALSSKCYSSTVAKFKSGRTAM